MTLPGMTKFGGTHHQDGHTLYSFYIFSAAVDHDGSPLHGSERAYGHNFAQFIRDNELGKVWETDHVANEAFHPDHSNKLWMWAPDEKALYKWREANVPVPPKPVRKPTMKFEPVPVDVIECRECGASFNTEVDGSYCPACDFYNGENDEDDDL
jgi:hypothetical protein